MNLHGQMMNLQTPAILTFSNEDSPFIAYKKGHRDARHSAAELAMKADALAEALRNILMHIGKGREDGKEWVCEPIHSDEIRAARAALVDFGDA